MPYHTPESKSEQAFYLLFTSISESGLSGVQIIKRGSIEDVDPPTLTILAEKASQWPEPTQSITGNYEVEMVFTLKSHYKDSTITQHDEALGEVTDLVVVDELATTLNTAMAAEQFNAILWTPGDRTSRVDGHLFVTEQRGTLIMSPSKA